MNLPQFTAEESLLPTNRYYRTNVRAVGRFAKGTGNIQPAEIINVHGCAPGDVLVESGGSWDCLPRSLVNWLLDPGGGVGGPPIVPPGGGGGGGGGGGYAVPSDIVAGCLKVGGNRGEKYCGGIGGPSCCKTCAQIVCQQKRCEQTERCDPSHLNAAKEANCDLCCSDSPTCKNGLIVNKSLDTGSLGGVLVL
jgi:hypothetical protein